MMAEPICICARCGHERLLSDVILDAIADEAFQQAIEAACKLPPTLADAVIRYMRLFGAIRHPAYAKLLADLVTAINAGRFVYKRQERQASPALWLAALNDTLASETLRLPLKAANGHNFLYAIAASKADKAAAAAETRHDDALRDPVRRDPAIPPPQPIPTDPPMPDPARRRLELELDIRHWRDLADRFPNDPNVQQSLASAQARLAAEFPS